MLTNKDYLASVLTECHSFVTEKGIAGLDPRLFWYFPGARYHERKKNGFSNLVRRAEIAAYRSFPALISPYLRLCGIPMVRSPYGLGMFIQAYTKMYQLTGNQGYLQDALTYADCLKGLLSTTKSGNLGAPNPLEDQSVVNLPAGSEVAQGFIDLYRVTGTAAHLEIAEKIADSFVSDYEIKTVNSFQSAIDYTSNRDGSHILNANALAIGILAQVGSINNTEKYDLVIKRVASYIAEYLGSDRVPYAGKEDSCRNRNWKTCDAYHTGFTLRGLSMALTRHDDPKIRDLIYAQLKNYRKLFLTERHYIRVFPQKSIVDIHGVAEYIRTVSVLGMKNEDTPIIEKNVRYMFRDGTFYYRRGWRDIFLYMPRWGHAPMMLAIAEVLQSLERVQ